MVALQQEVTDIRDNHEWFGRLRDISVTGAVSEK